MNRGYLSVDLFFILSGFLMCLTAGKLFIDEVKLKNYLLFMKKRFVRIYPIYFVAITVAFLLFRYNEKVSYIASVFLVNIAFYKKVQILEPIWSLSAEWITYLIFPFLIFLCFKIPRRVLVYVLPALALFIYLFIAYKLYSLGYYRILNIVSINGISRCIADYFIGITVYFLSEKRISEKTITAGQTTVAIAIFTLLFIPYSDIFIVFLMGLLVLFLSYNVGSVNKILSSRFLYFLGLISYSVYLIHPFFLFTDYYSNLNFRDPIVLVIRICAILITIFLSYFTYRFVEMPSLKYLKRKLNC